MTLMTIAVGSYSTLYISLHIGRPVPMVGIEQIFVVFKNFGLFGKSSKSSVVINSFI